MPGKEYRESEFVPLHAFKINQKNAVFSEQGEPVVFKAT
jgi:hypothetical protein